MICERETCDNPLNKGQHYCSRRCAALARNEPKAATVLSLPNSLRQRISDQLGEQGTFVLQEVNRFLEDGPAMIPIPASSQVYSDLVLSFDGKKDMRPSDSLDFDIIEMMLKSGPVIFALEMKRAQVQRVFSEGRFKVESPDKELVDIAEKSLKYILPKMALDFTWSAFAYGTSFQAEEWENKTAYQLGMSEHKGATKLYAVPKVPKQAKPSSIDHIRRVGKSQEFNGFVQKPKMNEVFGEEVVVGRDQALVIPLNEHFGNLWGTSFLKTLYPIWLWYEITLRTMSRYMERMAMPVTVGEGPARATVKVEGQANPVRALDLMLAVAGNVAKSSAVAIPSDTDENGNRLYGLRYLTADERGEAFIKVLEFFTQEMLRAALSADRSMTQSSGGVGSYNIGEVHAAASALSSEMILLQFLFYINKFFMPGFSLYNRGVNGPPIWLRTQAIDMAERELAMKLISVAGNSAPSQEFFWMMDWRAIGETSNIPLLTEEEIDELKKKKQQESLDNQRQQQKLMAQFGINQRGNAQQGGVPPKDRPGEKPEPAKTITQNGNQSQKLSIALESIFNGKPMPWFIGEAEVEAMEKAGVIVSG